MSAQTCKTCSLKIGNTEHMKAEQLTNTWEPSFMTKALRLCSHQAWDPNLIMPVTNVNTPFFQVFIPKFGHTSNVEEYGFDLTLGHYMVISHLQYQLGLQSVWTQHYFMPVSRHQWTQPKIPVLESHKSLGNDCQHKMLCLLFEIHWLSVHKSKMFQQKQ